MCKKTDSGELMVGCDGCDDWFHFSCLKIPEKYKELVFSFYCPYCQAGITGPSPEVRNGQVEVRRTIWKRKCRLSGCFKACKEESKYCSNEHGQEYMKRAVSQLKVSGLSRDEQGKLIKQILSSSGGSVYEFQRFGELPFADEDATRRENPVLYDKVVCADQKLQDLEASCRELQEKTLPGVHDTLKSLGDYLQWLESVNQRVFSSGAADQDPSESRGQRTKSGSRKQKRSICGFTPQWTTIPCPVDEFSSQYDAESLTIRGVCTKLRCNKHADWSPMLLEQCNDQLRSLQSHQDRLQLLIRARKEQLMIQFHEQLLRIKN